MALNHNIIIRGMNSVYLQCAHVTRASAADFIVYCQCWSEFVHNHHDCEEASYFPLIEKAVGVPGLADQNLEQHEAFMDGLLEFDRYMSLVTPATYSGTAVLHILDTFAATLQLHLTDEIVWIQGLSQTYPELDIAAIDLRHEAYVKAKVSKTRIMPFFWTNHDRTYENGIHQWWPAGNVLRDWFMKYICTMVHSGAWKFSSCSKGGRPKRLEIRRNRGDADLERGDTVAMELGPKRPEAVKVSPQTRANSEW